MAAVLPKLTITQVQTNPAAGAAVVPGSLVTYTVTIDSAATATADASNANLTLTLGNELTLQGTPTVSDPNGGADVVTATGTGFTVGFAQTIQRADQPITITYTAKVAATASQGDVLAPVANITYQNASPDEIIYATANNDGGTGAPFFYQYDYTTGTVTQFGTPKAPQDSLAFLGNGDVVTSFKNYNGVTGGIGLYNLTTGVSTQLVTTTNGQLDLAVNPASTKIYYNDAKVVSGVQQPTFHVYDLATGIDTTLVTSTNQFGYTGIAFTPDGKLYGAYGKDTGINATSGSSKIVEIDPNTGAILRTPAIDNGSNLDALRYDPFTGHLFVGNHSGGNNNVYEIDPVTLKTVHTFTVGAGSTTVDGINASGVIDGLSADGKGLLFVTSIDDAITVLDINPASPTYGQELHAVSTPSIDDTVPVSNHDNFNTTATTSTTVAAAGSLSGTVFLDNNDDGIKNGADSAVSGVTVQLLNSSGVAISGKTTTTDASGNYSFTGLAAGTYGVQFTAPSGDAYSPFGTSLSLPDSIVNATGKIAAINVVAGANTPNQNAGVYKPVSLSGTVFIDDNADGTKQVGDTPVAGQLVSLLDGSGNAVKVGGIAVTTTTDSSGNYSFTNLAPGTYGVKVAPVSGDSFSPVGASPTLPDSIVDSTGKTTPVTLTSGQTAINQNAGVYAPASLAGTVFNDLNADGAKAAADVPLSGQTVQLLDSTGTPIAGKTTTTDASGNYIFSNLTPGTYSVKVTPAAGETFSPVGTSATLPDSIVDTTGKTAPVTLGSGSNVTGQNAGEYAKGSLSGKVFTDVNADGKIDGTPTDVGLGGVTVQLLDSTGTAIAGKTTTTAADGTYSFTGLNPGNYSVLVTKPAGDIFSPQQAATNAVDSIVNPTTGKTASVAVVAGTDTPNQNAGVYAPASLAGTVFNDLNADGAKAIGDAPLAGQTVQLLDSTGTPIAGKTTTTDAVGNYIFSNLTPGTYSVKVTPAAGETFSPVGTSPTLPDSIVDTTGKTTPVTLGSGSNVTGQNAGEYAKGSLSGKVFTDFNADGKIDGTPTDVGLGGVTVQLLDSTGTAITGKTTTTAADGTYSFTGLNPGNYSVLVTKPTGDIFSPQQAATNAVDSIVNPTTGKTASVAVVAGTDTPNQNAGVYAPASLAGKVFNDLNADGAKAIGDAPLAGQTVQLLDSTGTPIAGKTTTTDAVGNYIFSNLTPGTYSVKVTPAAGETFSPVGTSPTLPDSIVDTTGKTAPVTLGSGDNVTGQNAGEYAKGSLSGKVFTDVNADGKIDGTPSDVGLGGVTVQLLDSTGTAIAGKTTTTATDGTYSFTSLNPSNYSVLVTKPAGDIFSAQQAVTNAVDSIVDPITGKTASVAVVAGTDTPNQNAGVYAPASLAGTVFNDLNADGAKATGDVPLSGQTVQLLDSTGTPIAGKTTTTDASGNYIFSNLTPGTYSVKVTPAAGETFTPVGTSPTLPDSIVDTTGKTTPVTLGSGDNVTGQNAGEYAKGSLSGKVFTDVNADGKIDGTPTDVGLGGVTVQLLDSTGTAIAGKTATTAADGTYSFTGLNPGNYSVLVTKPAGDIFSPQQAATNAVDSIVNPTTGKTASVAVVAGTDTPNQNAGVYAPASLAGTVFNDLNADGAKAAGDAPLAGQTVQLLDSTGTPIAGKTTTTDAAGNYIFSNLTPGTYSVKVTPAAGETFSPVGTSPTLPDSIVDTNGKTASVTLGSGDNVTGQNAGEYAKGSLSGKVFTDVNADGKIDGTPTDTGLGGVTVQLLDSTGTAIAGKTATTAADGTYSFTGLNPGNYSVLVTKPAGDIFSPQQAATNAVDSIVDPTTGKTASVAVVAGTDTPNQNAGVYVPASLAGTVFNDLNADGAKAAGDAPLSGQTVQLLDSTGTPIAGKTTTTDAAGNYIFSNLTPGTYSVKVTPAAGETFSPVGTSPTLPDSIVDTTGKTASVTLGSGDNVTGQNAGEYAKGSLSGVVFTDGNADGIIDGSPADKGLGGVSVQLLDSTGAPIAGKITTTAADGSYSFTGLNPGSYSVQVTAPTGDVFSPKQAATNAVDSIVDPTTGKTAPVVVTGGANTPFQNAGVYVPVSLSGTVFTDQNADGAKQSGDTSLAGQTVQLLDGSGNPIAGKTTTTDASGNYSFTNLVPGTYAVKVAPAAGDSFSPVGTSATLPDSIVNAGGQTAPVTLTSGQSATGQNAGEYVPASLSGNVFIDQNANGVKEAGDTNLGGQTVQLLDGSGNPIAGKTTTTDASGNYSFTGLKPATYTVKVTPATGDSFSPQQAVTNAADSIVNASGQTNPVTLVSGQNQPNQNAGEYAKVSLSGTVFTDLNDNGVKNPLDTAVPGVEVDLYKNGVKTALSATTDSNGNYSFTNLNPGNYSVQVVKPAGDMFSPVGTDAAPAIDSIVDNAGKTVQHTLNSGDSLGGQNAGLYVPPPKLTITKTESITSGQAGDIVTYTVTVAEAPGNTAPAFNVSIADLLALGETLITGSETVKGGSGGADTIVESGTGFTVTAPQLLAADKPIVVTYQARLDDSVYNGQSITNTAKLGYDSAPTGGVHYTGSDTQTLAAHLVDQFAKTVVPASPGAGSFALPGDTVTFELDATLARGTQHLVLTDTLPTGLTAVSATVVSEGQVLTSVPLNTTVLPTGNSFSGDFGIVTTPGSATDTVIKVLVTAKVNANVAIGTMLTNVATLTSTTPGGAPQDSITSAATVAIVKPGGINGMVFLDGHCDGIYHVGDPGIAGVTVRLLDKDGHTTGITTTTDSYGQYSFNRLIPGQYEVQVVAPQGTGYSSDKNAGTNPLLDSDVNPGTGITDAFVVGGGQTVAGVNAGLEFNGYFGGTSPTDIGNGTYLTNSGNNVIVGHGGNNVGLGLGGNNVVVLDAKGVASMVEIQGSGDDIVTSCGPLVAQTQTSGSGYIFAGNGGSSTLNGGLGNAYMMGAGSNDLIFGGAGHNVIIGGGSTGVVTTSGGVVTGYTDGDRLIAGGIDTAFLYEKGDGVMKIDGGLRSQDSLKISGYTAGQGQLIKVGGLDALWFGGNDLIVFYGQSPYVGGVSSQVSFTGLPGSPETVVVFGADGKPSIVASGGVVPMAPAPLMPAVPAPGGGAPVPVPGAASSQTINLSGYNQVFDYTKVQTSSNVDTTVKGSQGFATITVGDGANTVTAAGYGNVIKAGSGNNVITGGDTFQKITVGDGSNTITASGYANVITAGNGANVIQAGAGGDTVTVGHGSNTITATGSGNVIAAGNGGDVINAGDNQNSVTVGDGTNTVVATGYNNRITVGNGHNTITAGAGGDTVDLGSGSDTVALSGWSNLLIGGLGHASVSGGTSNVFQIEGVGSTGGLDVLDFGTNHNDVLDLSKVLSGIVLTPANIANYVNVMGAGGDTNVSVDTTGGGHFAGHLVATLHGAGASSLADLQAHSAIKLG